MLVGQIKMMIELSSKLFHKSLKTKSFHDRVYIFRLHFRIHIEMIEECESKGRTKTSPAVDVINESFLTVIDAKCLLVT